MQTLTPAQRLLNLLPLLPLLAALGYLTYWFLKRLQLLEQLGWLERYNSASLFSFALTCLAQPECRVRLLHDLDKVFTIPYIAAVLVPVALLSLFINPKPPVQSKDPGQATWGGAKDAIIKNLLADRKRRDLMNYLGNLGQHVLRSDRNTRLMHWLMLSGSGAGKTSRFFLPNLFADAIQGNNSIVVDMKWPDQTGLYQGYEYYRFFGREAYAFTPFDHGSANFPILASIKTVQDAREMAAMVYPPEADDRAGAGKIYRQWERSLLAAILFAHAREQGRHASFSKVYEIINVEPDELKFWITSRPDAHEQAVTELGLKQDTFTGVISGLKQNLQVFDNDQLAKSLTWGENNIDIRALLRAGSILYIGIDENKLGLGGGSVLLRIIKMYLDRELLSEAQHQGGSLKIMTTEWWDEFANLGVVPKIAENLALMRGRGVSLVLAIQNWAQVEHIYTRVGWEAAVGNNIAISMFFPRSLGTGDDPVRFERWLGETTAVDESQSSNRSGGILDGRSGAGKNQRLVARHLMSAAEMAVQAEETLLLKIKGSHPVKTSIFRLDQPQNPMHRHYKAFVKWRQQQEVEAILHPEPLDPTAPQSALDPIDPIDPIEALPTPTTPVAAPLPEAAKSLEEQFLDWLELISRKRIKVPWFRQGDQPNKFILTQEALDLLSPGLLEAFRQAELVARYKGEYSIKGSSSLGLVGDRYLRFRLEDGHQKTNPNPQSKAERERFAKAAANIPKPKKPKLQQRHAAAEPSAIPSTPQPQQSPQPRPTARAKQAKGKGARS